MWGCIRWRVDTSKRHAAQIVAFAAAFAYGFAGQSGCGPIIGSKRGRSAPQNYTKVL